MAVALAAPAEDGSGGKRGGRKGKIFARFDENKDGKLTSDEVPERLWALISKCDTDQDGAASKEEMKACKGKRKGKGRQS